MQNLPPQLQKEMQDFQMMGEQLQFIAQQKVSLEASIKEKEEAIKILEDMEDSVIVHKFVGSILIKKDKPIVLEELKDEKLTLEMRRKTIERKETSMKQKFEEMQQNLKQKLGNQ